LSWVGFLNFGFTINPEGSERHTIGPPGSTTCIGWSPNGRKVLCNVWGQHHVQRRHLRQLTFAGNRAQSFTSVWSPDGQKTLFQRAFFHDHMPTGGAWYTIRRNGTDPFAVTKLPTTVFAQGGAFFYSWGALNQLLPQPTMHWTRSGPKGFCWRPDRAFEVLRRYAQARSITLR